jgi:periplasmic protein TonB
MQGAMDLRAPIFPQPTKRSERAFWIGLLCAALVHAGLIVEVSRSAARYVGERDGDPEALNVEIIDAAELKSRSTLRAQSPSAPPSTGDAAPPQTAAATPAEGSPEAPASLVDQRKPVETSTEKSGWEPVAPPSPPQPKTEAVPKPKDKSSPQQKQQLSLNLDLPRDFAPIGRSTAAVRPPDITRSGENDEFGRGVIRALRRTMPSPRGQMGRVTVRILLNDHGNLAELELISGATDPIMTQEVMFSVRQSSFPLPPVGATVSDRLFLVTYIYN